MFTLTGTLRQWSKTNFKDTPKLKVWVEHTTERDNGPADLKLEELFLPLTEEPKLPQNGSEITLQVRPWVNGKHIGLSATSVLEKFKASTHKPQLA